MVPWSCRDQDFVVVLVPSAKAKEARDFPRVHSIGASGVGREQSRPQGILTEGCNARRVKCAGRSQGPSLPFAFSSRHFTRASLNREINRENAEDSCVSGGVWKHQEFG